MASTAPEIVRWLGDGGSYCAILTDGTLRVVDGADVVELDPGGTISIPDDIACTSVTATGAIVGGSIDGPLGSVTPAAVACTTLAASGAATVGGTLGVTGLLTASAGIECASGIRLLTIKHTITHEDQGAGAQVMYTVPAGYTAFITDAYAIRTAAFDGTSPVLDLGTTGTLGDADGLLPAADLTAIATGLELSERGASLVDGGGHMRRGVVFPGATIIYEVGGSGATAGSYDVYVIGQLMPSTPA